MLTIQRLRDEAKNAFGARFDYRAFRDVVSVADSSRFPCSRAASAAGLQQIRRNAN